MPVKQRINNCFWFDNQAEEAATFYTSVFSNSKIESVLIIPKKGMSITVKEPER